MITEGDYSYEENPSPDARDSIEMLTPKNCPLNKDCYRMGEGIKDGHYCEHLDNWEYHWMRGREKKSNPTRIECDIANSVRFIGEKE